jgi:hypothetical protein
MCEGQSEDLSDGFSNLNHTLDAKSWSFLRSVRLSRIESSHIPPAASKPSALTASMKWKTIPLSHCDFDEHDFTIRSPLGHF